MPLINIEFDDAKVSDDEIQSLSEVAQKIVSESTGIEDVFVYANSAKIKIKVAPIEIFVQITAGKINNIDALTDKIKAQLSNWKLNQGFDHPINLTLMPMQWKVEIDI
jgi:phosphoribosyl-dephospho-CoA transferase